MVLRRGESATAEEIIQFPRERVSSYKLPGAVEFRQALPRSFIGKVLRRALVEGGGEIDPGKTAEQGDSEWPERTPERP